MQCEKCEKQFEKDDRFCSSCGHAVGAPVEPEPVEPADNEARAWAVVMDTAIVVAAANFITGVLKLDAGWITSPIMDTEIIFEEVTLTPLLIVIMILYHTLMEASPMRATFGKRFNGIVVSDRFGRKLGYGQALVRSTLRLGTIVSGLGVMFTVFDDEGRVAHDWITRNAFTVIDDEDAEPMVEEAV